MNKIQQLANINGLQTIKSITKDELEELKLAIDSNVEEGIIDELADVIITTQQLIHSMQIESQVSKRVDYKIKRQFKRFGLEE